MCYFLTNNVIGCNVSGFASRSPKMTAGQALWIHIPLNSLESVSGRKKKQKQKQKIKLQEYYLFIGYYTGINLR